MKTNLKIIIFTVSALTIGLLLGWWLFGSTESESSEEHQHTSTINGESVWTCSMHPQIRQNEPGSCPICAMDLIPLEIEADDTNPMAIKMTSTAMQLAEIETIIVAKSGVSKNIRLYGKIAADERLVYSQSSHIPGRIEKLLINFTGEFVKKGQTIGYIYSPDLVTAQEELFEAEKINNSQPALFTAAREKLKNWKLNDQQIDRIISSGKAQQNFAIMADVSGYVTQKSVNLGDYITKGTTIYEIVDLSKVWAMFDVYENDMSWVKTGSKIEFSLRALPGQTFEAKVSYIDPVIDPKTRVTKARIELNNSDLKFKPEMFVSGKLASELSSNEQKIAVPKSAIMWTGTRSVVYVKSNSEQGVSFMLREVTLGLALGDQYVVEKGLEEGDEIAINGTFNIDAAAQLAGKPSMMNPEGGVVMTGHNHGGMSADKKGMNITSNTLETKNKEIQLVAISSNTKEALKPLFISYFEFKDALVTDDFPLAKKAGKNMSQSLSKINMSLFTGESHDVWMKYSNEIKSALQHIEHFTSIEELRTSFQLISENIIYLGNSFNPIEETLFVQHCPMANSNKGAYWMSMEKDIKNPYFGQGMLTCGEVKSTIK